MSTFIEKLLQGEEKAFLVFYQKYYSKILTYVKNKVSKPEDIQELTNDILLEAIDSLPFLKKEENLSAWLYKIAHNKIVDFYRKRKIKSVILSQIPFLELIANETNQPEFIYEKNLISSKIELVLSKLSKRYSKILKMHYEENISIKDISKELNLSFKATESLLFRARKSFQKNYAE